MIAAYREPDKKLGKQMMKAVIESVRTGVVTGFVELRTLGHNLKQRAADVLAFFDRPRTSNDATEALSGLLEHPRSSARGNLTNYVATSLLDSGGFRPRLHAQVR